LSDISTEFARELLVACDLYFLCLTFGNIVDTDCIEQNMYNELETQYIATKSKIIGLLKDEELWAESENNKTSCHDAYQLTDMPKISFPEFNANQVDWEDFRDMFIIVVHDDKTMPLVKKMHYLKGCFNTETARIMNRIPLNTEVYKSVWPLIFTRFDNSQRRFETYLHCFFEAKPLNETTKDINVSMDCIEQFTRSMNGLENFKDCIYLYTLKKKSDEKKKRGWEKSLSDTEIPKY